MGSWTLGADNATVRNVPEPGASSIQPRREIPALGAIRSIRFDGRSIYHAATFKIERPLRRSVAYSVSYTLSSSKDDASSPGATEAETNVPQDVRNIFDETGEWARSSFDHRHLFVASGTWLLPRDWRVSAVFLARSGAPFTVNLGRRSGEHRRRSSPATRCAWGSESPGRRANPRSLVRHLGLRSPGAVHLRNRPPEQRGGAGVREPGSVVGQGDRGRSLAAARGATRRLQRAQPRELRSPEPHLRDPELRTDLQREERARAAAWRTAESVIATAGTRRFVWYSPRPITAEDTMDRSEPTMRRRASACLVVLTIALMATPSTRAVDLRNILNGYSLASWGINDGLPSSEVLAITQDADGFLWLGTDGGLVRFDGTRFTSWSGAPAKRLDTVASRDREWRRCGPGSARTAASSTTAEWSRPAPARSAIRHR